MKSSPVDPVDHAAGEMAKIVETKDGKTASSKLLIWSAMPTESVHDRTGRTRRKYKQDVFLPG